MDGPDIVVRIFFNTQAVMQLPLFPFMSLWLALRYDSSAIFLFLTPTAEVFAGEIFLKHKSYYIASPIELSFSQPLYF